MTSFVGVASLADGFSNDRYEDLAPPDAGDAPAQGDGFRLAGHSLLLRTAGDTLFRGANGHSYFVAAARLDNRAELADAIGLSLTGPASDARLLFRMFERWGGDGVARCVGAFAFAHWDARARRLTLGRDCLGHCPLLFYRTRDEIVFSNRLGALLGVPGVPREVDEVGLANVLVVNGHDTYRTVYRAIERAPARSLLTIDRSGLRCSHYWTPKLGPPAYRRDEDYIERARELFDQAVISATAGTNEIAIAASGGLHSSAVAATVARLGRAKRVHCYTTLPPDDADVPVGAHVYRDERDKVEALGRMYPALDLNWLTRTDVHPFEADETRYFALTLLPRRNGITLGGAGMLLDALSRHPLVLFGTRGNLCLSWAGPASLLALLRSGAWARFVKEVSAAGRRSGRSRMRVLSSDVLRRGAPRSLRAMWRCLHERGPGAVAGYAALNPDFIAQSGLVRMWRRQGFEAGSGFGGWDSARRRAWHLFDRANPPDDNINWPEQAYGIAVRDPFTDRRLLEFALSVPEPLYCRDGVPRSFARAVFADRLPPEILREQRRGANNLAWFRTLDRRRAQIAAQIERIEASATARRLLDTPRLKRLLDDWPRDEHAAASRERDYRSAFARAVHVGNFIRWVEDGMCGAVP